MLGIDSPVSQEIINIFFLRRIYATSSTFKFQDHRPRTARIKKLCSGSLVQVMLYSIIRLVSNILGLVGAHFVEEHNMLRACDKSPYSKEKGCVKQCRSRPWRAIESGPGKCSDGETGIDGCLWRPIC